MVVYLTVAVITAQAAVAQVVAHLIGSEEVTGPSPVSSLLKNIGDAKEHSHKKCRKCRWYLYLRHFFAPDYKKLTEFFLFACHASKKRCCLFLFSAGTVFSGAGGLGQRLCRVIAMR